MNKLILSSLLLAASLFFAKSGVKNMTNKSKEPRGIRNNNPGNILKSNNNWRGKSGYDGRFVVFSNAKFGIRALAIILKAYSFKYGLNNVRDLIMRYAPEVENNTSAYISHVAKELKVKSDEYIDVEQRMSDLIKAIIKHENGKQPYSERYINEAIEMAGVKSYV